MSCWFLTCVLIYGSTTGIMTAGVRVSMADGRSEILYQGKPVLRARLRNNN